MSRKRISLGEFISMFGNAIGAAAAVRERREPQARHLRGLGIDPEQFRKVRY